MGGDMVEDNLNVVGDAGGVAKGGGHTRRNVQGIRASKHDGNFSVAAFIVPFVSCEISSRFILLPSGTGIKNNTKYTGIVVAGVHGIVMFWTRNEISETGRMDFAWRGGKDEIEDMDGG